MKKVSMVDPKDYKNTFTDVNAQTNSSLAPTVETALKYNIISSANKEFRPTSNVTRSEAYAMLMSSVCLKPTATNADWQKNIWQTAKTYGLTTRELGAFEPTKPVLTQELFVMASKVADWAEKTGGCTPRPQACLNYYSLTVHAAVIPDGSTPVTQTTTPAVSTPASSSSATNLISSQTPGTFVHLYDTDTDSIYSYIIKIGGKPSLVRQQYLRLMDAHTTLKDILVEDVSGKSYAESYYILANQTVFVHIVKPTQTVSMKPAVTTVASTPEPSVTSTVVTPGVFVLTSETDTQILYSYTVKSGGNIGGVRNQFKKSVKLVTGETYIFTDVNGKKLSDITAVTKNQVIHIQISKPAPAPVVTPVTPVTPVASTPAATPVSNGNFIFSSQTDKITIYQYTLKLGGNPAGVRKQYLATFGSSPNIQKKLTIRDAHGKVYIEGTALKKGEVVFVYIAK